MSYNTKQQEAEAAKIAKDSRRNIALELVQCKEALSTWRRKAESLASTRQETIKYAKKQTIEANLAKQREAKAAEVFMQQYDSMEKAYQAEIAALKQEVDYLRNNSAKSLDDLVADWEQLTEEVPGKGYVKAATPETDYAREIARLTRS